MTNVESRIAENLGRINAGVDAACRRAGRKPSEVTLVGVTKSARPDWIEALIALGVRDLGESRPQQLLERVEHVENAVRWHLIGHLQRNKVRKVLPVVECLHSLDSLVLAARVDSLAAELGLRPRALLEVNVSGEASKDGFTPEQLVADWSAIWALRHIDVAGLMTMAAYSDTAEDSRATFRQLRALRDRLAGQPGRLPLPELSMGMSGDFEVAVEEGATLIRVGTGLFEGLSQP